ncbi:hypothetical protein D3C78_1409960 [compost metagenome]
MDSLPVLEGDAAQRQLKQGPAIEGEALRISSILLQHIARGAIRQIFYAAQHLVQQQQLMLLVEQIIFVSEPYIFLALKQRIRMLLH